MFKDVDDKLLVIAAVWSLLVIAMAAWMVMGEFPATLENLLTFGLGGLLGLAVGKALGNGQND